MQLEDVRIAVLLENYYQELELWYPVLRFREAGCQVSVVAPQGGEVYGSKLWYPARPDIGVKDIDPADFDCVVIPGGFSPESLRCQPEVLDLVRTVHDQGGIVAAICHAGWVLASAGLAKGRRLTCVYVIQDDVVNAGAEYVKEPVVRDGNIITAPLPNDIPDWCRVIHEALVELPDRHNGRQRRVYPQGTSAAYSAPAKVKTGSAGPGSANYFMYAAAAK